MKKRLRFCKRLTVLCAFLALWMAPGMGWGQVTAVYTITSTSAVTTTGTAPSGSSATYSQTYGTAKQITANNSATLTLSGYQGLKITSIILEMHSNTSAGAGSLSCLAGSTSIVSVPSATAFNKPAWYGAWSVPYVNVIKTPSVYTIGAGENVVILIAASQNSLYVQKYSITYESAGVTPAITVTSSMLSNFTYVEGSGPSSEQTFTVSGSDLTADISIAAPTNYEISKTSGTGYTSPLTFTPAQAATPQTVYVRLKAGLSARDYNSEVITASSTGATSKTVTCSGTVTAPASPEPSSHATNFTAGVTAPTYSAVDVIWTDATGGTVPDGYVVKASDVSYAAIAAPVDGVPETAGALVKVVDAGVEEASFTGLDENTPYYFKIWPFTNSGAAIDYKTDGSVPQDEATTTYGLPGAPTATVASDVSTGSFTANWNTLPAATSYRLDVYTIETVINAADLFISEYVDGVTGTNKAIEIYNGTGSSVDLSNYRIWLVSNGGTWPEAAINLSGTLANDDVFVVTNATEYTNLTSVSDLNTGSLSFNGNDAVGLAKNISGTWTLIDAVGTDGTDPGTGWDVAGITNATADHVLSRKSTVSVPTIDWNASRGTTSDNSQWVVAGGSNDDATHLGSHTMAGGNSQAYVSGYENLNVGNVGSYTVTGLNPGTAYYYVVRAVNDAGTSANSSEISATTTLPAYVLVGANDNASNYSSWVNTSDEGCGFGAWSLSSGGSGGSYLGGTALGTSTFGIYSGGAGESNFFTAGRGFIDKMPVGSTFSLSLGYTGVSNGGSIGINLFSGINHRFTFKFVGGNSFWVINDGGSDFNTTIPWSGSTPLSFAFTRGSGNIYSLEISQGVTTYIANNYIANSGIMDIDRIEIFTAGQGSGENLGFDELAIASDPLLIPAVSSVTVKGCVTLEDDLEVEDLTIESGNTLHISGLSDLTVNGVLTNNAGTGGLLLQSDGAATGSLIHHTANVPATVQLYLTGAAEAWHLLSSPVDNQAVSGDFTPSGTYGDGTGYDLYAWDEPTETWLNQKTGSNNITSFVPAIGYLAAYQSVDLTKSFTGALNEGIYLPAVSISGTGNYKRANLLGNPYPSSIDWKSVSGLDKSDLEGYENGGVSFYVWNEAASNYGVYNDASAGDAGTNGTSRYIAPMQGFFVIAAQAGEFGMDNDARAHNAQAWLKSDSENEFRLRVTAPSNAGSDEVLLDFGHADAQGGAEKWFSMAATAPALYVPSAEKDYSIRFLSSVSDYPAIPLAFKAGLNGEYTLSAGFHPAAYSSVMLTDQLTGKVQDLKANPVYAFTAATGDDPGRFLLSFGSLDIEGPQAEAQIQIYACAGTLYLNTTDLTPAVVRVYNLTGQLVMEAQTAGHALTALPAKELSQGIYVVNVVAGNGAVSRKVAIRP